MAAYLRFGFTGESITKAKTNGGTERSIANECLSRSTKLSSPEHTAALVESGVREGQTSTSTKEIDMVSAFQITAEILS